MSRRPPSTFHGRWDIPGRCEASDNAKLNHEHAEEREHMAIPHDLAPFDEGSKPEPADEVDRVGRLQGKQSWGPGEALERYALQDQGSRPSHTSNGYQNEDQGVNGKGR